MVSEAHVMTASARGRPLTSAGLLMLMISGLAVSFTAPREAEAAEVEVDVERRLLTASVGDEPLADVLREVAAQTGIDIRFSGDIGAARPQRFSELPLETGIRRLVGPRPLIMVYGSGDPPPVTRIRVGAPPDPEAVAAARQKAVATQARTQAAASRGDDDAANRLEAVRTAARDGGPGSFATLATAATDDDNVAVRQSAVQALGRLQSPEALDPLREAALGDEQAQIRIEAVRGLLRTDTPSAADVMIDLMSTDNEPQVRRILVQLASSLDPDLSEPIFDLGLNDENDAVRLAAEALLND